MDFKVNINQYVKVKLTDFGVKILRDQHQELHERISAVNGKDVEPFELRVDNEGYYTMQLWALMNTFGHVMTIDNENPFDVEIIIEDGKSHTCD